MRRTVALVLLGLVPAGLLVRALVYRAEAPEHEKASDVDATNAGLLEFRASRVEAPDAPAPAIAPADEIVLRGRVFDAATAEPIPGACVRAICDSPTAPFAVEECVYPVGERTVTGVPPRTSVRTDRPWGGGPGAIVGGDGTFEIAVGCASAMRVVVVAAGFVPTVVAPVDRRHVTVGLSKGRLLRGLVSTTAGDPVPDVRVVARGTKGAAVAEPPAGPSGRELLYAETSSSATGTFELRVASREPFDVRAGGRGEFTATVVASPGDESIRLAFAEGLWVAFELSASQPGLASFVRAELVNVDSGARSVLEPALGERGSIVDLRVSRAKRVFLSTPAGKYRLEVSGPAFETWVESFETAPNVVAERTVRFSIDERLERPIRLRFRRSDGSIARLTEGAWAIESVAMDRGSTGRWATSGTDDGLDIYGMTPGRYPISLRHRRFGLVTATIEVRTDVDETVWLAIPDGFRLVVVRPSGGIASLDASIVDEHGNPVAAAWTKTGPDAAPSAAAGGAGSPRPSWSERGELIVGTTRIECLSPGDYRLRWNSGDQHGEVPFHVSSTVDARLKLP